MATLASNQYAIERAEKLRIKLSLEMDWNHLVEELEANHDWQSLHFSGKSDKCGVVFKLINGYRLVTGPSWDERRLAGSSEGPNRATLETLSNNGDFKEQMKNCSRVLVSFDSPYSFSRVNCGINLGGRGEIVAIENCQLGQ